MKHYPKSSNKSTASKTATESVITITTTDTVTTTSSLPDREIEERLQVYRPELRETMRYEIIQRWEDRQLQIENERRRK